MFCIEILYLYTGTWNVMTMLKPGIRKDIQKLKVPNWKILVQDRRRWKELVEKAKTLYKKL